MSEAFVSDCMTQLDYLANKWFPQAPRPQAVQVVTPQVTFTKPRELSLAVVATLCLLAAGITALVLLLVCRRSA